MKIAKGKSAYIFLVGLAGIITGAVCYYFSEKLEGWENVQRAKNLETWAYCTFIPGVLLWVYNVVDAFNTPRSKR